MTSDLCSFPKYINTSNPDRRSRIIAQSKELRDVKALQNYENAMTNATASGKLIHTIKAKRKQM